MRGPYRKYGVLALLALLLLLGLLLVAAPAGAETRTAYTATTTYLPDDPDNAPGDWVLYEKKQACALDIVEVFWTECSDPRRTGRNVQHLNSYGQGHFWGQGVFNPFWAIQYLTGTLYVDYGGGGVWEGSSTATYDRKTGTTQTGVDYGVSGSVAGLRATYTVRETAQGNTFVTTVTETGYIIEP